MRKNTSQTHITHLFSYPIASADMYYSVENERDVYISDDPVYGFRVWGEISEVGEKSAVDLCDMLFEYAMTCTALGNPSRTLKCMESFGARLGKRLAKYIKNGTPITTNQNLGTFGLECVMEAMHAHFVVEEADTGFRFILKSCPICTDSKRKDLPYADLVHFGIYKLCQRLVQELDPLSNLYAPVNSGADHLFSLARLVAA